MAKMAMAEDAGGFLRRMVRLILGRKVGHYDLRRTSRMFCL